VEIRALLSALRRNKTGPLLVSAQVAITLAVLVNVAYIVRQRVEEVSKPTGMDLDNMFWIATGTSSRDFNYATAVKADLIYLNSLPGVVAASTINNLPQTGAVTGLPFASNLEALQRPNGGIGGLIYFGTDKLLDTLGLKLIAGRNFDLDAIKPPATDFEASLGDWAQEVIITQMMAKKLFPDGNAIGKPIYAGLINKTSTVVGIVDFMRAAPAPARYDDFVTQIVIAPIIPSGPGGLYVVRAKPGQRAAVMRQLEKNFADQQPGRFVSRMEDYTRTAAEIRQETRTSAVILAIVALFVLAVTVVGISGLAAFNVTTRTKQLGIRRAIGARKFHILRYFLVENWIITTCGTVLGCMLALAAGIKLSITYEIPRLPLYYLVGGVLLLWIVGLLAVLVPARRAASISPAVATRTV
jgi:putative ABC transport system permease protein